MGFEDGLYPSWEFLECGGDVPERRSGHTCALHQNRFLYIFGGFDGSNCFDDLYILDLESRLWRKIEAGGECPSGRASHSAVTDELVGVMYIFGGSGSHFGYTNKRDLWEFSFEVESWRLLSNPIEDTPSARYGQSMVAYQEGLYVWGGTHGTNYPTDMHRFDLCSKQWEYVNTTGDLPRGRYRHQAMVKDDLMYIVGGSGINRYGDVFTFHFGTSTWQKIVCTGTDMSDGRYAHSAVLCQGYILLYGGNDGVRHDDLQQLDLERRIWSRVGIHGQCPAGRDFHAAVLRKDHMVIFGGSSGMRRHNDVFEFHMSPKMPSCTLSADLECLLDRSQTDESAQRCCDVMLCPNGLEAHAVYCHSQLLLVRCPRLFQLVKENERRGPSTTASEHDSALARTSASCPSASPPSQADVDEVQGSHTGVLSCAHSSSENDDHFDSLLRAVWDGADSQCRHAGGPGERLVPRVNLDLSPPILWHLLCFIYSETTKFGLLTADQLYGLLIASVRFDVPRLAALCDRQIAVRLCLDNVLPLLRASARDGAVAQSVQEACKLYFLGNYHQCTELRECEALDPKMLCDLMRLHNARASGVAGASPAQRAAVTLASNSLTPLGAGALQAVRPSDVKDSLTRGSGSRTIPGPMPEETLVADLRRLLTDQIATDFEVVVQDQVIHAHKFVLAARSRYFASCILTSGMVEAQAGRLVIPKNSGMTAEAFHAFLRFLYAGDDILHVLVPHTAMYLVDASSFYGLTNHRLKHCCERCIKDAFNESQVLQLFEASSRLYVEAVRSMALDFIIAHFHTVCHQPALEQLDKSLLIEILKRLAEHIPPSACSDTPSAPQPRSLG